MRGSDIKRSLFIIFVFLLMFFKASYRLVLKNSKKIGQNINVILPP